MSEFRIFETGEFRKKLRKLPAGASRFVEKKLAEHVYPQLRQDPFLGPNIKKLKGYDPATWRYRVGKLRVFFMVDPAERTIFMLSVDDLRDAYR
ncbi:MAG: type II toxin-antitoxin system RelE/ParE family toxin [Lentisphaerae bacterium]|nr:type II toxin-antitoxin system RelE/ParE family toxin [Lentisphaerota bacterium]